jgi:hypothetical protein
MKQWNFEMRTLLFYSWVLWKKQLSIEWAHTLLCLIFDASICEVQAKKALVPTEKIDLQPSVIIGKNSRKVPQLTLLIPFSQEYLETVSFGWKPSE